MTQPNIPPTMQAWRKHKGDKVPRWEQIPVPPAPTSGFLVKLLACGVCHSDYAMLHVEDRPRFRDVFTLGHEGCGEIMQIGSGITDKQYTIGTKVALLAVPGCGENDCANCSRDMPQLCERGQHHGIGEDGFYAEYVAIDIRGCVLLPPGVDPSVAAVATDAVTTAYHGVVRRAEVRKEETVFLFGLGGLGFNALQIVLKAIQARVIVTDVRQERLDAALELGVPKKDIVPLGASIPEWIQEQGLTERIDTVLEFVGKNQTFSDAQKIGESLQNISTTQHD
jgi:alcohol dehydrogenase, propanol-preferring